MCQKLKGPDGATVDDVRGLRRIVERIVLERNYESSGRDVSDEYCLCCVDMEATAKANGMNVQFDVYRNTWVCVEGRGDGRV